MSYLQFLGQGSTGAQTLYRRDYYNKDEVVSTGTTHSYKGHAVVVNSTSTPMKEVMLDQAVKVTTVADSIRNKALGLWSRLKNGCMGTFTATLVLGLASAIAAIVAGILLPPLWPIAVAAGILSLAILGFSVWNLCRSLEAKTQMKQWSDPLPNYQNQRREIGTQGFYHAYQSNLVGKFISEEELKGLWFSSMDQWAAKYESHVNSNHVKLSDLRGFMEKSPLKPQAMNDTFGHPDATDSEELKILRELSTKFSSLDSQYKTLKTNTAALKQQIQAEKQQSLLHNQEWLQAQLAPYDALIYSQKLDLISLRSSYMNAVTAYEISCQTVIYQTPMHAHHHYKANVGFGAVHAHGGHVVPGSGNRHRGIGFHTHAPITVVHNPITPPHIIAARAYILDINHKLQRLDLAYNAMTAPLRAVYSNNAAKINHWANGELKKIDAAEDVDILKFYPPVKALLEAYLKRNVKNAKVDPVETEVNTPKPSKPPKMDQEHTPPSYDTKWKEFFGEVDWKKGVMKKTTVTHEGNNTDKVTETFQAGNNQ